MRRRLRGDGASAVLLGVVAGAWAAVIGLAIVLLPMLAAWIASPHSGLTWVQATRLAGTLWAVAQATPVTVAEVTYSLTPWGFAIGAGLLVAYATTWAARRSRAGARAWLVLPGVVAGYGLIAAVVALTAGGPTVRVDPGSAAAHAAAVAFVAGAVALAAAGTGPQLRGASWLVAAARAGTAAALAILGAAGVLVAIAVLARFDDAAAMAGSLEAGPIGGLVLLVLGVGYLPVAIAWGAAYLLGAGVVLGPAVTVSPFVAVTGSTLLPPFPLLAAVPTSAGPLAWLLPTLGVLAGAVAATVVVRADRAAPRLVRAGVAALAALVAGVLLAAVAALSAGSLGDLRLAHVGPSPVAVGLLAALAVALGAVPLAALAPVPGRPGLRVAGAPGPQPSDDSRTGPGPTVPDQTVPDQTVPDPIHPERP